MRFTNIIAVAASLLSVVSAAPAPVPTTRPPSPVIDPNPPVAQVTVPSVAELMTAFAPVMAPDSSLFYTGGTNRAAVKFIEDELAEGRTWQTIGDVWSKMAVYNSDYWQKVPGTLDDKIKAEKEYGVNSSIAFAKLSTGKVKVTIPSNWDPVKASSSVWEMYEKPALKALETAGTVTEIMARKYKRVSGQLVFEGPEVEAP